MKPQILLLSEDPTSINLITLILNRLECQILTAASQISPKALPDLILLDYQPQILSRNETALKLNSSPYIKNIPAIVIVDNKTTGAWFVYSINNCINYLNRPLRTEKFKQILNKQLQVEPAPQLLPRNELVYT
jgi:CheY-like chemotaxis protein